ANGVQQMADIVNDIVQHQRGVDLVKTRQYPNYKNSVTELWRECAGKLPLIIDEFQRKEGFEDVLKEICATGTTGGLLWSLMKHPYNGGIGGHVLSHSYPWGGSRWPGFDSGDYFNERTHLQLIREYGYKIRGMEVPPIAAPEDPPYLYESLRKDVAALKWRVSPGARHYVVERATSPEGPWTDISGAIDISHHVYFYPLFSDTTSGDDAAYYYRVFGKNESGVSPPSNVIGPLERRVKMVMDNLSDFSLSYFHSDNLQISSETWPRLRQTEEDFYQAERVP